MAWPCSAQLLTESNACGCMQAGERYSQPEAVLELCRALLHCCYAPQRKLAVPAASCVCVEHQLTSDMAWRAGGPCDVCGCHSSMAIWHSLSNRVAAEQGSSTGYFEQFGS